MRSIPKLLLTLLLSALVSSAFAAPKPIKWAAKLTPADARAGEGAQIVLVGTIEADWHIYSLTQPNGGPLKTTLELTAPGVLTAGGAGVQKKPHIVKDKGFNMDVQQFEKTVVFGLPVTIKAGVKGAQKATVRVRYQAWQRECVPAAHQRGDRRLVQDCAGSGPRCKKKAVMSIPVAWATFDSDAPAFNPLEGTVILIGGPQGNASAAPVDATTKRIDDAKKSGLPAFLLLSFGFGFLALLTPCVFPMIPITVSYFTKRKAGERGGGTGGALAYCLGIIATFTVIGLGVTVLFGERALTGVATNPYVNIGFAALFVVLALNLMGFYEIAVPAGLANKIQSGGAKRGGYMQPFLLGLAFSLTSFTCTTAYVGTLLAAAAKGDRLYPLVGMLGFSAAFALPFFLLALFPQAMAKMPKSGVWLVTVKTFMGMLELAAALKFLSNADLVWGKGLLTRPTFLVIWAAIGVMAGLYLLGLVRLPKHGAEPVGPTRRSIGVVTALVGLYCLAAIKGAPLGWFSAFPPPSPYPYATPVGYQAPDVPPVTDPNAPITWLPDYEAALRQAKTTNKPILINFTGVTCTNCRQMENNVFTLADVKREFRHYVTVELYTDRGTSADDKNQELEQKLVNTIALPVYVVVSPQGKVLKVVQGLTPAKDFVTFLQQGRGADLSASL